MSLDRGDGLSAAPIPVYPWSVLRFLTASRKRRLEDYTEVDLREFLLREASTAYEWRHYERAVRSFFAWCRYLAGLPQARGSSWSSGGEDGAGSWPRLQPLLRLVVVIAFAICLEVMLALTIIRSTK
jgi:hypothetical protein